MPETLSTYQLIINSNFDIEKLYQGTSIVLLHANRIPPHIGMVINGCYHSLSIKGRDIKTPVAALIKNINQRKIEAIFIGIKSIENCNEIYLMNRFIEKIQLFERVENAITCLSPVKLFFEDIYNINIDNVFTIHELLMKIDNEGLLQNVFPKNINDANYSLPEYSFSDIQKEINEVRKTYK